MEREKIKKQIGGLIVFHRKRMKIKQKNLAKMIDKSIAYMCDVEKARIMPSLNVIYKIAEVLNIEISDFFKEEIPAKGRVETFDSKIVGKRIIKLRSNKHILQCDLAMMINKSPNYLCDIERGRCNPSMGVLYSIADSLDVRVWELFI